jgi:tRNA (guanine-N7-)-methyltransferase
MARMMTEVLPELACVPDDDGQVDLPALFGQQPERLWLEVGIGAGEHLAWQAEANPDVRLIGAEFFLNGVASAVRHLHDANLSNVRIMHGDGRVLVEGVPQGSVERAFVLHPDPWPKKRHWERRIIQPAMMDALARAIRPGGELRLATDHADYQPWMTRIALAHPKFRWTAERADDWRQRAEDWPQTRYEAKAVREDRKPLYLSLERLPD